MATNMSVMSGRDSERESEYLSESEGRFSDDGSAAFDVDSEPRRNQTSARRVPSIDHRDFTPSGSFPLSQGGGPHREENRGTESGQSYLDDDDNRDSGTSFSSEGYITVNQVRLSSLRTHTHSTDRHHTCMHTPGTRQCAISWTCPGVGIMCVCECSCPRVVTMWTLLPPGHSTSRCCAKRISCRKSSRCMRQ